MWPTVDAVAHLCHSHFYSMHCSRAQFRWLFGWWLSPLSWLCHWSLSPYRWICLAAVPGSNVWSTVVWWDHHFCCDWNFCWTHCCCCAHATARNDRLWSVCRHFPCNKCWCLGLNSMWPMSRHHFPLIYRNLPENHWSDWCCPAADAE